MPGDNPGLLDALSSSSALDVDPWYDQVRKVFYHDDKAFRPLHFFSLRAQIEAWFGLVLMDSQPHITIQCDTPTEERNGPTGPRARPICVECDKDFSRAQELERHVRDKHMPRRQCPFCDFSWTRPDKIKAHILDFHAEKFTTEMLQALKTLCGRQVTEFVDAYNYIPDVDASQPMP